MINWFEHLYPYSNIHELNLDWIIQASKKLYADLETFKNLNSLTFADPILWDITTQYAKGTIVLNSTGDAFISKEAVPAGIQLDNSQYWEEIFNFADYVRTANSNLTFNIEIATERASKAYEVDDWLIWNDVLYKVTTDIPTDGLLEVGANIVHFTVEDFIKAWINYATNLINQYKNDIDASELAYKNQIDASELAYRNQLAQDIATTTSSLQAQLNTAIAGATVDSEVINARVGFNNVVYSTLGEAIRTQITNLNNFATDESSNIQFVFTPGYYNLAGNSVDLNTITPSDSGFMCSYVQCNEGDTFTITGTGGAGARLWGFADNQYNLILVANENTTEINAKISAPANAAYFIVNAKSVHTYSGELMVNKFNNLIDALVSSKLYNTNNLIYKIPFKQVGSYWVADVNPDGLRLNISIELNDASIDASNYSFGVSDDGTAIREWLIYDGSIAYSQRYFDSRYLVINRVKDLKSVETVLNKFNIMVNIGPSYLTYEGPMINIENRLLNIIDLMSELDYITNNRTIHSGNYSTYLPDLDYARRGSSYVLNFEANDSKPYNMPDDDIVYNMATLFTLGSDVNYIVQILLMDNTIYKRIYNGVTWSTWNRTIAKPIIDATPSTLLELLEKYNSSDPNNAVEIHLSNGTYDVYQMYIDYYGADFWTNYAGNSSNPDSYLSGVWLKNIKLIGKGHAIFTYSGEATAPVKADFSMFSVAGHTLIENIIVDIGTDKLRYAVHDDFTSPNKNHAIYNNIIFKGSPHLQAVIGGGMGQGAVYEFNNCVFLDNTKDDDISYHGNYVGTIPSVIVISNCYGSKNCVFLQYGQSSNKNDCIVNNSTFKKIYSTPSPSSPNEHDNMNLISYNNVQTNP